MIIAILLFLLANVLTFAFAIPAFVHFCIYVWGNDNKKQRVRNSFFLAAKQRDVMANFLFGPMLNAYFSKGGYRFGHYGETLSSAYGKKWTEGTLTEMGLGCVGLINYSDRSVKHHCYVYIEGDWPEYPLPPKIPVTLTVSFTVLAVGFFLVWMTVMKLLIDLGVWWFYLR